MRVAKRLPVAASDSNGSPAPLLLQSLSRRAARAKEMPVRPTEEQDRARLRHARRGRLLRYTGEEQIPRSTVLVRVVLAA